MSNCITLVKSPGIPPGFCLVQEKLDGKEVWFLRRVADDRRIEIKWIEGTRHYSAKELSAYLYRAGDEDNPILKGLT